MKPNHCCFLFLSSLFGVVGREVPDFHGLQIDVFCEAVASENNSISEPGVSVKTPSEWWFQRIVVLIPKFGVS